MEVWIRQCVIILKCRENCTGRQVTKKGFSEGKQAHVGMEPSCWGASYVVGGWNVIATLNMADMVRLACMPKLWSSGQLRQPMSI